MIKVLTKVPHRWRGIALISVACILIFSTLQYIQKSTENNGDLVITRKDLVDSQQNSKTFFSKNISKQLYGIDNFESQLPKLQANFEEESEDERQVREARREAIKKSFLYGWNGYKTYALGADELKPLSNEPHNPFGGLGATLLDSLSTILVMELDIEFEQVLPLIEKVQVKVDEQLSVFETTIRDLGGLLSAYELSDHPRKHILLEKAEEIGLALLPAFDTPYGIPHHKINPVTEQSTSNSTFVADAGTIQLEFFTLSYHTGNTIFAEKAQAIIDFIDTANHTRGVVIPGLYPFDLDIREGLFKKAIAGFGAMGDSAYEYFLKEYILSDGQEPQYARMYQQSIDNMKSHMLLQLPGSKFLYLPAYDTYNKRRMTSMDHLTCFAPGMLAIGSKIFNRPDDMIVAKGLLETCVHMYRSTPTNLAPEIWGIADNSVVYDPLTYGKSEGELSNWLASWTNKKITQVPTNSKSRIMEEVTITPPGMATYNPGYFLRPETVESLYILYRTTGDPIYQEYGWLIYEGLEKHCKTKTAYASLINVREVKIKPELNQLDSMETFLFAETFKYLYLLFTPPEVISLDKFVFNTEAHPLLRRPWTLNLKNGNNKH